MYGKCRECSNTTSLAFSPDDHKVAAGDNVGTLRLWDISGLR